MEPIKDLFEKSNILISLRYYEPGDFAVNWEIGSIAKHRVLFESLYSTHPLDCVSDIHTYYYYLLTRKLFRMGELVHQPALIFNEKKDADLLSKISRDAEYTLIKTTDSAIEYINKHFEEIFLDERYEYDLKYISIDFIVERQEDINYSVFEYLCQNFSRLILNRFGDLRETFIKYRDLFTVLFPSGHLDLKNPFGLQDVLGVWRHEYRTKDSQFRQLLDGYVDDLCHDAAEVLSEYLAEDSCIVLAEHIVKAVSLFLQQINSRHEKEFLRLASAVDYKLVEFLRAARNSHNFKIPHGDAELKKWKSIDPCESELKNLTHHAVPDVTVSYESFLEKSPAGQNADSVNKDFSEKREDLLLRLAEVNIVNFFLILNNTEIFDDYKNKVCSEINFISVQTFLSDNSLKDDVSMMFCSLGMMVSLINNGDKEQCEFICYGASMFICGLTEKLLRLIYLYTVNKDPSKYKKFKTDKLTLKDLLSESAPISDSFSINHKRGLAYFLITLYSVGAGRNYRNSLAHWETGMTPGLMTPFFTSRLLWLFTDVLNSIYLYFETNNGKQAVPDVEH